MMISIKYFQIFFEIFRIFCNILDITQLRDNVLECSKRQKWLAQTTGVHCGEIFSKYFQIFSNIFKIFCNISDITQLRDNVLECFKGQKWLE